MLRVRSAPQSDQYMECDYGHSDERICTNRRERQTQRHHQKNHLQSQRKRRQIHERLDQPRAASQHIPQQLWHRFFCHPQPAAFPTTSLRGSPLIPTGHLAENACRIDELDPLSGPHQRQVVLQIFDYRIRSERKPLD